ncbi:hypothetical protein RHMOL_Rhmol12G0104600 [Rhododendron molle]|uniref:Uncharacterized protein n=1 Tax=Rhododendron molle TaxID=49168 RepID=A0ACC0LGI3_RHOML|nr:hypothetical protein RHMOL_Rhmol12G0104600 [Rhododendron molle]
MNGWISTPLPDRDREPRGVEARAAESCAGEEEEDAKASSLSKTLELGSLFGLWFLCNIYFNIYNKQQQQSSFGDRRSTIDRDSSFRLHSSAVQRDDDDEIEDEVLGSENDD